MRRSRLRVLEGDIQDVERARGGASVATVGDGPFITVAQLLAATCLLCGCACAQEDPEADVSLTSGGDPESCGGPLARLLSEYTMLETVAGLGQIREKGENGWKPEFEGRPATEVELSRPHFAMADAGGRVFIADKDAHAVRVIEAAQTIHTLAGVNAAGDDGNEPGPANARHLSSPNGLWVNPDGTLYILDLGNDKVRRVDPAGEMSTLFTTALAVGRGLWVSADESVAYVASGSVVKRWTAADEAVVEFAGGFAMLGNLFGEASGSVVVTDRGANKVYRLDAQGKREPLAGNGSITASTGSCLRGVDAGLHGVRGVWPLFGAGYLLATHETSQLWYLDQEGFIHLFIDGRADGTHSGDGEPLSGLGPAISEVRSVSVSPDGTILLAEHDAGFIRAIR
ncbi:MAG: hypothetical protein V3V08_10120 [Nannocystaceae bacterium]